LTIQKNNTKLKKVVLFALKLFDKSKVQIEMEKFTNRPTLKGDSPFYLTATVIDWIDVFTREGCKNIIIDSLKYCINNKGLTVYAYCLMSNHIHLIASASEGNDLGSIIRDFKKYTSKAIFQFIQEGGESRADWMLPRFILASKGLANYKNFKIWQEGNYPIQLYSKKFYKQKMNYIHNNPVKAKIVNKPEHYLYSSAIDYAGGNGLLPIILIDIF